MGSVVEEPFNDAEPLSEDNYTPAPPAINLDEADCPSLAPAWMATFSDLADGLLRSHPCSVSD